MSTPTSTIGRYLVERLEQQQVRHVFGIPGDYVLSFFDLLVESPMQLVGTCTEIGAGYAADAYARVHGLGVVCVTYCVEGLNALNAVAGAYAEKSPLVLISGAPGMNERARSPLLHHKVRGFNTQRLIYEQVTVASAALEDASTAPGQIDHCLLQCMRHKRPVYLELPRDMVDAPCPPPRSMEPERLVSDSAALHESVEEAAQMLNRAKRPVILAGVEVHRFGLQKPLLKLVEGSGFPIAATLLGKSILRERHPQYLGVYEGALGQERVRRHVESADAVLILGAFMTDINLGVYTAQLDESRTINATSQRVTIRHHHYEQLLLQDFIEALSKNLKPRKIKIAVPAAARPFQPQPKKPMSVRRFFMRMNEFLKENFVVICDIGDSLFGAADLEIHRRTEFISPAYYTSMGFATPAAVGVQVGSPELRPIVFVGDGAFQMTGQELSTVVRYGLNPILFVLNNRGYTTERFIREGPYNDIHEWAYHLMPQLLRKGWGAEVRTEGELEEALATALSHTQSFSIINVHLDPHDHSQALARLGKRLGRRVEKTK